MNVFICILMHLQVGIQLVFPPVAVVLVAVAVVTVVSVAVGLVAVAVAVAPLLCPSFAVGAATPPSAPPSIK